MICPGGIIASRHRAVPTEENRTGRLDSLQHAVGIEQSEMLGGQEINELGSFL